MGRKRRGEKIDGWYIVDKTLGMGSTNVVSRIRRLTGAAKVGHGGTLDPLATGILPIALGEATKAIPYIMDASKDYEVTMAFGHETTTDDLEGAVTESADYMPSEAEIIAALPAFTGPISQVPPAYSAIKIDGERAYDVARRGDEVVLKAREVRIHALELMDYNFEEKSASLRVCCGKGTYIRSLARDLARHLNARAHVTKLRRTRVGPFGLQQAISLPISLENGGDLSHSARSVGHPLEVMTALDDIPALAITDSQATLIRQGQTLEGSQAQPGTLTLICGGQLVAVAENDGAVIRSLRVFNL